MITSKNLGLIMKMKIFFVFFFALPVHAQMVKCSDAKGRITYSGIPCQASERELPIKGNIQVVPHLTQAAPAPRTGGTPFIGAIEMPRRDMRSLSVLRSGSLDQTLNSGW
jgi:hypothetical protein